jgi:thioesterase domain-containing protein
MKEVEPTKRAQIQRLWAVSLIALRKYHPTSPLNVSTTLFTTDSPFEAGPTQIPLDNLLGWKTWISAPLECQPLHGHHLEIFSPEGVDLIARVISRTIHARTASRAFEGAPGNAAGADLPESAGSRRASRSHAWTAIGF